MAIPGKLQLAHRVMYEQLKGPIPEGLELDHLCRNRACINPDHLEPVTGQVNNLRGEGNAAKNAKKTHCPKGHPLEQFKRRRICRPCLAESYKRYSQRYLEKHGVTRETAYRRSKHPEAIQRRGAKSRITT